MGPVRIVMLAVAALALGALVWLLQDGGPVTLSSARVGADTRELPAPGDRDGDGVPDPVARADDATVGEGVAPGGNSGTSPPVEVAATSTKAPDAPVDVAMPAPGGTPPSETSDGPDGDDATAGPALDLVRVEPDGRTQIAGRAAPDSALVFRLDGVEVGRAVPDADGSFVAFLSLGALSAPRALAVEDGTGGRTTLMLQPETPVEQLAAAGLEEAAPGDADRDASAADANAADPDPALGETTSVSDVADAGSGTDAQGNEGEPNLADDASGVARDATGTAVMATDDEPRDAVLALTEGAEPRDGQVAQAKPGPGGQTGRLRDGGDRTAALLPGPDRATPDATGSQRPGIPTDDAPGIAVAAAGADTTGGMGQASRAASEQDVARADPGGTSGPANEQRAGLNVEVGADRPVATGAGETERPKVAPPGPDGARAGPEVAAPAQGDDPTPMPDPNGARGTAQIAGAALEAPPASTPAVRGPGAISSQTDMARGAGVPAPPATAAPGRSAPSGNGVDTAAAPAPPKVLVSDAAGVRVLQAPPLKRGLELDTIAYDAAGRVTLAGRADAAESAAVRVYVNGRAVLEAPTGPDGAWDGALDAVSAGTYTLRVDALDPDGNVTRRVELPFRRETPAVVAAAGPTVVTVQPGNTLWGIARETYGSGLLYVRVFEANRGAIRDPDLIYPGQIFDVPDRPSERVTD